MAEVPNGEDMVIDDVMSQLPHHLRLDGRRNEVSQLLGRLIAAASMVQPRSEVIEATASAWSNHTQVAPIIATPIPGIKHWEQWRPRHVEAASLVKQQDIERQLAFHWRDQILGHFRPFASQLAPMVSAASAEDVESEQHDLFGAMRWGTLRSHARSLATMLKRDAYLLLPDTDKCLRLLNQLSKDSRMAPSTPARWVRTISFLANTFRFEVDTKTLEKKCDAIAARLDKRVRNETKRAQALTISACQALERAVLLSDSAADKYAAGHFRVLLGSSARWDDGQHTDPRTPEETTGSITLEPWQQKNLDRTLTPAKMIAMTAPT